MAQFHKFACALALLASGSPILAQSTNTLTDAGLHGARARAGIVVPFGAAGSRAERAPRLEAWSEPGRQPSAAGMAASSTRDVFLARPIRIGVTLDRDARIMLNGQEAPRQGNRHGVSTLGVVGIVVGAAVLVVGLTAAGAFGNCPLPSSC
jgi:hypothetical protein